MTLAATGWPGFERPGWVDVAAAGALPGMLLGAHLAGLLFFLNPELPFGTAPLLSLVALYGGLLGLAGLILQLPLLAGRPARARRFLPWGLTAALTAAAVLAWTHASHFAYYLPPGINGRLLRAAVWLSVTALTAFYTALLHSLARRRYGPRSRWLLVLVAALSLFAVVERRGAWRPPSQARPLPSAVEAPQRLSLLVVGLEGATLDALLPLAEQGRLPFLAKALREGAYGRLASFTPNRPRALWTTLATGKRPYKHRVLGDRVYPAPLLGPAARLELLPRGVGFRVWGLFGADPSPAGGGEALRAWEVLPRVGLPAGVVSWPGSAEVPAAPGMAGSGMGDPGQTPAFVVGERFFSDPSDDAAARPAEVATRARLFRLRPGEIDPVLRSRFGSDPPPAALEALARDLWRESLCAFLLEQYREVQAVFLHLPGLGEVSRAHFGGYAAAQFEGAQREEYLRSTDTLAAYYGHLDETLAGLWEARTGPTLLAVVSAYGTEEGPGWRRALSEMAGVQPLEGRFDRSPDGVLLLYGDGVAAGAMLSGAELVDVMPTLAYGLGLPIARDLDGRVLTSAFERSFLARRPLTFVPSYETLRPR